LAPLAVTDADERELFGNKYYEWLLYAAPRIRAIYRYADAQTKRDAWARCSDALRDEINRIAKVERLER
jgi:plasmid stabilization system protein ParE